MRRDSGGFHGCRSDGALEHSFYTRPVTNLTQAWTVASAALPNGWRIVGVVHADLYGELAKLPTYLELASTYPEQWVAVARGRVVIQARWGRERHPSRLCSTCPGFLNPSEGLHRGKAFRRLF